MGDSKSNQNFDLQTNTATTCIPELQQYTSIPHASIKNTNIAFKPIFLNVKIKLSSHHFMTRHLERKDSWLKTALVILVQIDSNY